jgi:hypothetical protein
MLITINARRVSVISAITASVAPSESDQTSPINICAGCILNQRNAMRAHAIIKQNAERMKSHFEYAIKPYAAY